MYSKFILNSNWVPLSSDYIYDSNVTLKNQKYYVDGNVDLYYTSYLSRLKDYSNNNYSLLFLTDKNKINEYIDIEKLENSSISKTILIANLYIDEKITEDTGFLLLSGRDGFFKSVKDLSEKCFLEYEFINSSSMLLYRRDGLYYYYYFIDPFYESLNCLSSTNGPNNLNAYDKEKIKLSYSLYEENYGFTVYRYYQNNYFYFSRYEDRLAIKKLSNARNYLENNFEDVMFTLISVKDVSKLTPSINWFSYKRGTNLDNININPSRSFFDVKNNFLFHFEYFNDKEKKIKVNSLTLKNQLTYNDESLRFKENEDFRSYTSIFAGGKREEGYESINLSYKSNYITYSFLPDKTTWFHIPETKEKVLFNINDSNFVLNGAIAGSSPIFSDKIWKKNSTKLNTSNFGDSSLKENTGQWLCAWLSGGDGGATWVNRYYNPDIFSPFDAIKYSANVNYTPQFKGKYKEGIVDIPSDLTIETGGWYAYSRFGQKAAKKILNGLENNIQSKNLKEYKDINNQNLYYNIDEDGMGVYTFSGKEKGIIDTSNIKQNSNNFTFSFYASRENWNVEREYQLIGNYLNNGIGFFNNEKINPIFYYLTENDTVLTFTNYQLTPLLTISLNNFLSALPTVNVFPENTIAGVFYKSILDNFIVITNRGTLIEFNSNGTVVDVVSAPFEATKSDVDGLVKAFTNNNNFGVYTLNSWVNLASSFNYKINLDTKEFTSIALSDLQTDITYITEPNENNNLIITNQNKIFALSGFSPVIKGNKIYFGEDNSIKYYDIDNNSTVTYLSSSSAEVIKDFTFDKKGRTLVLFTSGYKVYDALGNFNNYINFYDKIKFDLIPRQLSLSYIDEKEMIYVLFDNVESSYFYEAKSNTLYNVGKKISYIKNYDFCFDRFVQSTVRNVSDIPTYKLKIKLRNLIDTERVLNLETLFVSENFGTGKHHFAIALDTLNGVYDVYVDGILYSRKKFTPGKFFFGNLFADNISVGAVPFYGGIVYSDFYKTKNSSFYSNGIQFSKIKIYDKFFNSDEVKMLLYEDRKPHTLNTTIKVGDRSYIDTMSRVFKNKSPGKKSNLINLSINNTNIDNLTIQQMYNNYIVRELKDILPGYAKINKITWNQNKQPSEKMLEGFFNRKNSLTEF